MAASSLTASSTLFPKNISSTKSYIPSSSYSFPRTSSVPPRFHVKASAVSPTATTSVDVEASKASLTPSKALPFRVGHGFDLHRLEIGYPLIIGGITVPHEKGCEAHSDGTYIPNSFTFLISPYDY